MSTFFKYLRIQFLMDLRERSTLMNYYLVPILFFFVIGSVFSSINPLMKSTLAASMSIFSITMGAIMGAPIPIVKVRESGTLRAFRINGIPDVAVLAVQAISSFLHLMIVSAIIYFAAPLVLHAQIPPYPGAYAAVLLLYLCASVGIGVLIGTAAQNQAMSSMLSMIVFLPTVLFSGIMFPIKMLPESFRWVSWVFPGTHAMQAFIGLAYNRQTDFSPAIAVLVLAGIGIVTYAASIWRIGSIRNSEQA
ncbi:MAG: type transporter [Bacteroidetes bacterium]|nr:type transporter [Bacteroidota bacterium]